jgi:D-aminoacyl-tRNA deacylase
MTAECRGVGNSGTLEAAQKSDTVPWNQRVSFFPWLVFRCRFSRVFPMRAVVQRVSRASVTVNAEVVGAIQQGLLILLGVAADDAQEDVVWLAGKVAGLRVFEDGDGKMNLDLTDVAGSALVVSQFTLLGDCRKGRRPVFVSAARPELADSLYQSFVAELRGRGVVVETGTFQAQMDVELVNDGPVTLLLDSRKTF